MITLGAPPSISGIQRLGGKFLLILAENKKKIQKYLHICKKSSNFVAAID
jgi:hypothetical protein